MSDLSGQFFFLDARRLQDHREQNGSAETSTELDPLKKHKQLYTTLLKDFSHISKPDKAQYDSLAVVNVSPSVVPNPYLPSFRIFSYNISGTPYRPGDLGETGGTQSDSNDSNHSLASGRHLGDHVDRDTVCNGEDSGNSTWLCRLSSPWHSSPESPSRINTLWTPLGFAQVRDLLQGSRSIIGFVVVLMLAHSTICRT